MSFIDADYLQATVGVALTEALAEVSFHQPEDPVAFVSNYLRLVVDKKNEEAQMKKDKKKFLEQRSVEVKARQAKIAYQEANNRDLQIQRAIAQVLSTVESWEWWNPTEWSNLTRMVADALQVPAAYIGRVDAEGDEEEAADTRRPVLRYPFAFPADQTQLVGNQILPEGEGVSWRALQPVARTVNVEGGEENPAAGDDEEGEVRAVEEEFVLEPVLIPEVMDCPEIVFHGMPQLGSFAAIPLTYQSALTVEGLAAAKALLLEQSQQRRARAEAEARLAAEKAAEETAFTERKNVLEDKITAAKEELAAALEEAKPEEETEEEIEDTEEITTLREAVAVLEAELDEHLHPNVDEAEEGGEEEEPLPEVMSEKELLAALPRSEVRTVVALDSLGSPHALRAEVEVQLAQKVAQKVASLITQREDRAVLEQAAWELSSKPKDLGAKFEEAVDRHRSEGEEDLLNALREEVASKLSARATEVRDQVRAYAEAEKQRREAASEAARPPKPEEPEEVAPVTDETAAPAEETPEETEEEPDVVVTPSEAVEIYLARQSAQTTLQKSLVDVAEEIVALRNVRVVNPAVDDALHLAYRLVIAHLPFDADGQRRSNLSPQAQAGLAELRAAAPSFYQQGSSTRLDTVSLRLALSGNVLAAISELQVAGPRGYQTGELHLEGAVEEAETLKALIEDRLAQAQQNAEALAAELALNDDGRKDDDEEDGNELNVSTAAAAVAYDPGSHPAATLVTRLVQAIVATRAADVKARQEHLDEVFTAYSSQLNTFLEAHETWAAENGELISRREGLEQELEEASNERSNIVERLPAVAAAAVDENGEPLENAAEEAEEEDEEISQLRADLAEKESAIVSLKTQIADVIEALVVSIQAEPVLPLRPDLPPCDDLVQPTEHEEAEEAAINAANGSE